MPSRISAELAHLARLARDGGLDLSQVSLRVKADLLMTTAQPALEDLAIFSEMATGLVPGIDEATAVILARKLAGWRHAPDAVLAALKARGGAVLAALLRHGMPVTPVEAEAFAADPDAKLAGALAERPDLSATAILILVERGDRAIDVSLMGNTAIDLPRAALDLLVSRSRQDAGYVQPLLARRDLSSAELAPLFLFAAPQRRLAMLDSLAALDSLSPAERRPSVAPDIFTGWLAMAASDRAGAFQALANHLGGGPALALAIEGDHTRDLAALALTAAGLSVEDATRFLIRLGDDAAHSVERIFAVVGLMRSVRPSVALRLVMQVSGSPMPSSGRKGQHQPVMDPSGTPARIGPTRSENPAAASDILRKLGSRRDQG